VFIDAHFHADDLYNLDPGFPEAYRGAGVLGLASVHDAAGLAVTRRVMAGSGRYLVSFGIHPQLAIMDDAGELERRAAAGELAAIGECGFDFYGDAPELVRTPENERAQREAFEFQLSLAERCGLPVVLHLRRATDLLFEYAERLSALRAVVLHSWPGPANEALDFLARCPRALFSFGLPLVNGNKKVRSSAAALPASAILTETDAPYQPPRGVPDTPGDRWPLLRAYSSVADLPRVVAEIASVRGQRPEAVEAQVERNFLEVFGDALQ
jgi:TatD DNase family protein